MDSDDDTVLLEEIIFNWFLGIERVRYKSLNIEKGDDALEEVEEDEIQTNWKELLAQESELQILRVFGLHIL